MIALMAATCHWFPVYHVLSQRCLICLMEAAQQADTPKGASESRAAINISVCVLELAVQLVERWRKACRIQCDRAEICATPGTMMCLNTLRVLDPNTRISVCFLVCTVMLLLFLYTGVGFATLLRSSLLFCFLTFWFWACTLFKWFPNNHQLPSFKPFFHFLCVAVATVLEFSIEEAVEIFYSKLRKSQILHNVIVPPALQPRWCGNICSFSSILYALIPLALLLFSATPTFDCYLTVSTQFLISSHSIVSLHKVPVSLLLLHCSAKSV